MTVFRVLIIGTGSIGQRHINNIRELDSLTDFVFLRSDQRNDSFSEEMGARVVARVADALPLAIDCAVIANPSALHAKVLLPLIQANIPMYIEKPVVTTSVEIDSIKNALAKFQYDAATLVGCNLRFLHSLQKVKELLNTGLIGTIARATFQAGQWLPDWRPEQNYQDSYSADPALGGGVVLDLIHELDAARWLLGDFDIVHSVTAKFAPLAIKSESMACIIMGQSALARIAMIGLDYVSRKPVRRYEFVGDRGTLIWDCINMQLQYTGHDQVNSFCEKQDFDVSETYKTAMMEFLSAIKNGNATSLDIHEGLKTTELAIRAKRNL
ncbi:MAG TPA: Gfo/Idh/MocA family oxidoreductase [bacterium (Candidatus Stahlbacteria)]|nr:Gfo/Idh/MocA family oxidoreductase [Candidatus Stahlbacteria bacterium]